MDRGGDAQAARERGVAVTGALGNLGGKLLVHLSEQGWPRLIGLDLEPSPELEARLREKARAWGHPEPEVGIVGCDLGDPHDARWRDAIESSGAVVHFAARNPYPEATWGDAAASLDMTLNAATAAARSRACRRFVLATSNHVMGRYRTRGLGPGELTPDLEPGVGTVWNTGDRQLDSTAYAAAKLAGERVCRALAASAAGATTWACIRIGWCQPGENSRETLSAAGTPTQARARSGDAELAATDRWFREMWLSNRDMARLFERALLADAQGWRDGFALVNGVSNNRGSVWSLAEARELLGYHPIDDVYGNAPT
jgi:nucleoside-diphosphate-sugar epimerase